MNKQNTKSKILIFDFDGTLVDSKSVWYKTLEKHLGNLGLNKKEVDNIIDLGYNVSENLEELGLTKIENAVKMRIMNDVVRQADKVKKCKDVDSIKKLKVRKILISNSVSEFIIPILERLKLKNCFQEIYGADSFDDKEEFVKEYLRKRKIRKKDVYYIGDRKADVVLARKVGCKSVIISGKCSWDSRKEVLASNPDFVLDDIKDLKKIKDIIE
jgi:phosphoglycolate phosphatase-like HAD superfamily hydrolase